MKRLLILVGLLNVCVATVAELSLKEIRTASDHVLAAYFKSTTVEVDEVSTGDLSRWKLNGEPVTAIHRFVTEADVCDHHIYLETAKLTNGKTYTVFKPSTGEQVADGTLKEVGLDESSGDHVYRIDLSAVPEGGPYKISVKGYGCSYPFGVGGDFSRRLAHVSFRALYHQRCGCPVVEPYAWNIRHKPCHTTVYDTAAPIGEARLRVRGDEPTFTAYGGYHDAGDADRRTYHMDVTCTLLTTYEAFPGLFTDGQYNIPDQFDDKFHILGQGNGIPDILDEAEWGARFWEVMQKPSGEVHWGTETYRYSPFTTYDRETNLFGTEVLDPRSAGFASGMFMHLARLIQPYKPERSDELRQRADRAFAAAGDRINTTHHLYYAAQKYLPTGDSAAHQVIKELAPQAARYVETFNRAPESFAGSNRPNRPAGWLASFFYSYILEQDRPTDPAVVEQFMAALKGAADKAIDNLAANAYPVGTPMNLRWWGSNVAQGQYAYPCLPKGSRGTMISAQTENGRNEADDSGDYLNLLRCDRKLIARKWDSSLV